MKYYNIMSVSWNGFCIYASEGLTREAIIHIMENDNELLEKLQNHPLQVNITEANVRQFVTSLPDHAIKYTKGRDLEKAKERSQQRVKCACGSEVSRGCLSEHKKTKKNI